MAGGEPGFYSMKQLRVMLFPRGWDASPLQGSPQQYVVGTHFIHVGGERQCLRKQYDGRDWASTKDLQI